VRGGKVPRGEVVLDLCWGGERKGDVGARKRARGCWEGPSERGGGGKRGHLCFGKKGTRSRGGGGCMKDQGFFNRGGEGVFLRGRGSPEG